MSHDEPVADERVPGAVPSAGMFWGVKASFLRYLVRLPDLDIALGDGAEMLESGLLSFPLASSRLVPADEPEGVLDFTGQVLISAHGGMLRVHLAFPRLEIEGSSARLLVGVDDPGGDARRVTLATLEDCLTERDGADLVWSSTVVSLDAEGVKTFGGQYQAGQALEPVYVRLGQGPSGLQS